ncbi:Glutathione-regulated potassium-efflux system protein KefB [Candidatus Bilamarchaeum dharawalense]|uniref:Glutathione-regulated potassium-efflux system protein KefB n=1 Tax=Candidatus Bilamarchaeum dharawalense TaxID=2885759 RepID=A0A5E4LP57_9ARCH|nr:Glutathione-regulated potassium-efflux system protein KefB [Candidatus Bilamarchaeum dharawalense]
MDKKSVEKVIPWIALLVLGVFILLTISVVRTSLFGEVEGEKHIYFEIVFLLLLAVAGELLVTYTKQPSVMILMILGLLMSPGFLQLSWGFLHSLNLPFNLPTNPPDILRLETILTVFAQLGAVILLFKVGMHNKIERIFALDNLIVAIAGVVLPFAVGYLYASYAGGSFAYSMFVAAALTATSVGVTVAILKEFKLLKERFAEIIIGAAVLDDILGLLVLSFVINITGGSGENVAGSLAVTLLTAIVFLLGSVLTGKYFIEYLDKAEMSPKRFMLILAFVLFYAYFAEFIKLSAIVGAFMAGIILNQSKHHAEIEEKTYGLEMLFMPIFFISLGTLMDVNALADFFVPIMILTVLAIATKVVGCGVAGILAKLKSLEAAIVGFGMSPRGEVALIVASIGLTTKILNVSEYSIIATMALLTTLCTPPILQSLIAKREKEKVG